MEPSTIGVVYDACVLYPAPLRDLLMWLGVSGRFQARWTAQIHDEWKRNLLRKRPDISAAQLDRTSALMDQAIPDARVAGYESLIAGLHLQDPDDRHVLAAAIHCRASVIVTFNLRDFPAASLAPLRIEARHPDAFIEQLFDLDPAVVIESARRQRATLKTPPMTVERYLDTLRLQGLVQTVEALAAHAARI